MLLKQRVTVLTILNITWKNNLLIFGICVGVTIIDSLLMKKATVPGTLPALIGAALAFFIAFNNNQAYDRWWEARIIWGGLVNDSRSFSRALLEYCSVPADGSVTKEQIAVIQRRMIYRHLAFLYALKSALRKSTDEDYKKFMSLEDTNLVTGKHNIAEAILHLQSRDLEELSSKKAIEGFRFLALNDLIRSFCDGMGKSERIQNTVFPVTYIYFTEIIIWIFVGLTTMSTSETLGPFWTIFFGWLVGFIFYNTHVNGLTLMNPFKLLPGGMPLDHITRTIEINFREALGEEYIPEPVEPVDGRYLL
ncbi:MAG: hypothetical protein H7259_05255 [Cytophagales bacterium]|nr:hypothetical protein [Cytophaga sp.]